MRQPLTARSRSLPPRHVQIQMPEAEQRPPLARQRSRIQLFQQRWQNIKDDLPPQFSRRHSEYWHCSRVLIIINILTISVGMISIGQWCSYTCVFTDRDMSRTRRRNWHRLIPRFFGEDFARQVTSFSDSRLQDALYHGGPLGALLAYFVIGTVVYCLCISIGEMISFLYVPTPYSEVFI